MEKSTCQFSLYTRTC